MKKYALLVIGCVSVGACTDNNAGDSDIKTVQFERYFDKADFDNLSGKIEVIDIFRPEFTDSTMFTMPDLAAIHDGKAYVHEDEWMAEFDYPSGKLIKAFNRKGGGPEEYMDSYYAYFSPASDGRTVVDANFNRDNLKQYDHDGNYLRTTVNDTIQSLSPLPDGGWLAYNRSYSTKNGFEKVREKKVYQYDPDWNLVNTYVLNERRWAEPGSDRMDAVMNYNGQSYIHDNDSIYRLDTDNHTAVPVIALDLGKHYCDWGSLETYEEIREAFRKYIYISSPIFNSRYLFASYSFDDDDNTMRYDVYDLDNGELIYRRTQQLGEDYSLCNTLEGIPVEIDGQTALGWPVEYVGDDSFYVIVASDEMARISDTDAINPIFLKIKIKD